MPNFYRLGSELTGKHSSRAVDAPADRQAAVLEPLRTLAADPCSDTAYDSTWHWWAAGYGAGAGFVTFVIARDDHLVVIRLIDAA